MVALRLLVRRFRCSQPGCPQTVFCERLPGLLAATVGRWTLARPRTDLCRPRSHRPLRGCRGRPRRASRYPCVTKLRKRSGGSASSSTSGFGPSTPRGCPCGRSRERSASRSSGSSATSTPSAAQTGTRGVNGRRNWTGSLSRWMPGSPRAGATRRICTGSSGGRVVGPPTTRCGASRSAARRLRHGAVGQFPPLAGDARRDPDGGRFLQGPLSRRQGDHAEG